MQIKVVLDANAYRETNHGRSGKFASLVDFLKRSNSHLLLLPSVLEEVLATHDREFRKLVDDAKDLVEKVSKRSFAERLTPSCGKRWTTPRKRKLSRATF